MLEYFLVLKVKQSYRYHNSFVTKSFFSVVSIECHGYPQHNWKTWYVEELNMCESPIDVNFAQDMTYFRLLCCWTLSPFDLWPAVDTTYEGINTFSAPIIQTKPNTSHWTTPWSHSDNAPCLCNTIAIFQKLLPWWTPNLPFATARSKVNKVENGSTSLNYP